MKKLCLTRRGLGAVALVAVLAGCQTPASAVAPATARTAGASSMRALPPNMPLLYIGDLSTNDVFVYDYPSYTAVGTLTGFDQPEGMCTDAQGHVFVTNMGSGTVQEYDHGGTAPIDTFATGGTPVGCAVRPVTNDLAVADSTSGKYTLYPNENPNAGAPYGPGAITSMYYLGYDNAGYLYMDGYVGAAFGYEYNHNNGPFHLVPYSGPAIAKPGGVQWSGVAHKVWIGDQSTGNLYDIKLNGTQFGPTVTLASAACVVQFFIRNTKVVGPDRCNGTASIYHFPGGGVDVIGTAPATPVSSAISL
jgi:hypothetical protein